MKSACFAIITNDFVAKPLEYLCKGHSRRTKIVAAIIVPYCTLCYLLMLLDVPHPERLIDSYNLFNPDNYPMTGIVYWELLVVTLLVRL